MWLPYPNGAAARGSTLLPEQATTTGPEVLPPPWDPAPGGIYDTSLRDLWMARLDAQYWATRRYRLGAGQDVSHTNNVSTAS